MKGRKLDPSASAWSRCWLFSPAPKYGLTAVRHRRLSESWPLFPHSPLSVQPMPVPKTTRSTISNLKRREAKKDIATWYIWSILTLFFSPFPLCCRSKCYFAGPVACRLSRSLPKLLYLFFCFVGYHPAFWYYIRKGGLDLFMWFPFVYILSLTI